MRLLAQTELFDQCAIAVCIFAFQVGQQAFTTVDHHDQAAAGMEILGVGLEVTVEFVNAGGQQCDLDFRGAGVVLGTCVIGDNGGFAFFRD